MKYFPKIDQTEDLVKFVCSCDGIALVWVVEKLITLELCEKAVSYYLEKISRSSKDTFEEFREKRQLQFDNAKLQGEELEKYELYPIGYVPDNLLSEDLIIKSIKYCPFSIRDVPKQIQTQEVLELAVSLDGLALKYISDEFQTESLVEIALSNNPMAIQSVLTCFITQEMCNDLFEREYSTFLYFPDEYITIEMCLCLINDDRFFVGKYLESEVVQKFKTNFEQIITFDDFSENMRNNLQVIDAILNSHENRALKIVEWNENIVSDSGWTNTKGSTIYPLKKETLDYVTSKVVYPKNEFFQFKLAKVSDITTIPTAISIEAAKAYIENQDKNIVPLETIKDENSLVEYDEKSKIIHNLSSENSSKKIYYVSDLHIEHQLFDSALKEFDEKNKHSQEDFDKILYNLLSKKIIEMTRNKHGILLIGGDVADSVELSSLFYSILSKKWDGKIISILGNHELWDGTTIVDWINPNYKARKIEEIVADYRKVIDCYQNSNLLENQLIVYYKGEKFATISEKDILEASIEELREIILKSTLTVLGGIGYSGLNQYYNADFGLYRQAVPSLKEDKRRTNMFNKVYEKVKQCAFDMRVIILTHTPVHNWSKKPYNPNWIYVNGHTHKNSLINEENGITVLSDNQIGFLPKQWKLNAFKLGSLSYNLFEHFEDGIYKITFEQYQEFNVGRGILCAGGKYDGSLYVIKRCKFYMFVLKNEQNLYIMNGGSRKKIRKQKYSILL